MYFTRTNSNLARRFVISHLISGILCFRSLTLKRLPRILMEVSFSSSHQQMESIILEPPRGLHGMKELDKDALKKDVVALSLEVEKNKLTPLLKKVKRYLLKTLHFNPVQATETENVKLLFSPDLVKKVTDFDDDSRQTFNEMGFTEDNFTETTITLGYENWKARSLLKAVLPENEDTLKSYSVIGHIIHVNIKPHLLEYKSVIGQILLDKVLKARTVINKPGYIDSVYRNFQVELLCGEPDYNVTVKENGYTFKFDYSAVYWNPRLGTEHARINTLLGKGDILFDVFCGVGPFAIPAAKKKCIVYANDLNPESIKALNESLKLNKIDKDYIEIFNKDGADFICTDVKKKMLELWKDKEFNSKIVFVMNLPHLALDFLKYFKGLYQTDVTDLDMEFVKTHLPVFHCYLFVHHSETKSINQLIEERSGINLSTLTDHALHFVRNVSLSKNMYRFEFRMPLEYLIENSCNSQHLNNDSTLLEEPKAKKLCTESKCSLDSYEIDYN